MDNEKTGCASIDEYIAAFPEDIQKKLQEIRATIESAAPQAEEKISYQMPTFALKGNLVHFAAFKNHFGFFPGSTENLVKTFKEEISIHITGKGTLQFPFDQPIPFELITKIVKFRVAENLEKAALKARKK